VILLRNIFKKVEHKQPQAAPEPSLPMASQNITVKHTCQEISLDDFISCMVDEDYSSLGYGTKEEIDKAWSMIRIQYAELADDGSYVNTWKLYRDLEFIKLKIAIIQMCVDRMSEVYLPQFGQILAAYGFNYTWEYGTEQYNKQLEAVVISSKRWVVDREIKQNQWDKLNKDSGNSDKKVTRDYFEDTLLTLSKDAGYHLSPKTVTAYQFARMLVKYRKKQSAANRKNK
jgi:hypothetical protein